MMMVGPKAPHELAWSIERLAADTALQARLVEKAQTFARANSWSVVADRQLAIYQRFLARLGRKERAESPAAKHASRPASREETHSPAARRGGYQAA